MSSVLPTVNGSAAPGLSRRTLVTAGIASALPWPLAGHAQGMGSIRLCQSADLSGPLAELGQALNTGAKLYFDSVNAKGGIQGRQIELEVRDDGYDGKRALANATEFLADRRTFALFNWVGTPVVEAVLPKVVESGVPFFAPYTGAVLPLMKTARNVFAIRASYADEAEKLVQQLATIGIKRLAVVYQNNSFGEDVYASAKAAIAKAHLPDLPAATVESSGEDAAKAASKVTAAGPEAVLIGLSGKPAIEFVKAIRAQRRDLRLYALSVMATTGNLKALGADATGISFTQVVPMVGNQAVPVVRDFMRQWSASGIKLEPSHQALEGYLNAKIFSEALSRAGDNPTRASFIEAASRIRRYDAGGFEVSFTGPGRSASRFVELTMATKDGRLIR